MQLKKEFHCIRYKEGQTSESTQEVAEEVPISMLINGRHYATAMISPGLEKEFVLGHLLSEGLINGLDEVESLELEKSTARAIIKNPIRTVSSRKRIVSGCGGGASFLDPSKLPKVESDLALGESEIFSAMKTITSSELHEATGGVHSAGLFGRRGDALVVVEDIGRHNALDKAIGFGLERDVRFSETYAACTGRISSEMALKCSAAGIPVIISRGATTSLAIEIAEKTGLTIIGFVRGGKMNIYSACQRVAVAQKFRAD